VEHKIWSLHNEDELINVFGISEDSDRYYAWNMKLVDQLNGKKEKYLEQPFVEQTIIKVQDNNLELLEVTDDSLRQISDFVKEELWRQRYRLLSDYEKQLLNKNKKELESFFEGNRLVIEVDKGSEVGDYEVINDDVKDNKMHIIVDPASLLIGGATFMMGQIVGAIIKDAVKPLTDPISGAVRSGIEKGMDHIGNGLSRIKDRLRKEKPQDNKDETVDKLGNLISMADFKKRKEKEKKKK
jgi:hypothetical protein